MKKIIFLLFLVALGTSVCAQKSYINVAVSYITLTNTSGSKILITGDVPTGIDEYYLGVKIGYILNLLSQKGYEVEFMSATGGGGSSTSDTYVNYLLSKKSSSNPSHIIQTEKADDDSDVYEVARYNLQGMPISKNEGGVQIVVYSNYTTKTIIVE